MAECGVGARGLPEWVKLTFPQDINKIIKVSLILRKYGLVLVRVSCENIQDLEFKINYLVHVDMCVHGLVYITANKYKVFE